MTEHEAPAIPDIRWIGEPDKVAQLMTELALAQGDFTTIQKDQSGQMGHRTFQYAPLSTILQATRPALAQHGIALLQPVTGCSSMGYRVTTVLAGHGARVEFVLDVPAPENKGPDAVKCWGSSVTYHRRYAVNALLCLDAEPDADSAPHSLEQTRGAQAPPSPKEKRTRKGGRAKPPPVEEPRPEPTSGPAVAEAPPAESPLESPADVADNPVDGDTRGWLKEAAKLLGYSPQAAVKRVAEGAGVTVQELVAGEMTQAQGQACVEDFRREATAKGVEL